MKFFEWIQVRKADSPTESCEDPVSPGLQARLAELEKMSVKEVMTPRSVVMALDADVQLRRVRRLKSSKSVYFPVYKGDLDHILGWISKHKVLELLHDPNEEVHLAQYLRPAGEVNEDATVADLADAFLKSASPFLVVKNSQGSTVGIVPLGEFVELVFGFEMTPSQQGQTTDYSAPLLRSYEI